MSVRRLLGVATVSLLTLGLFASGASAAVTISRSELSGTQLRVEGSGAIANHAVTVNPGAVTGTSDSKGQFRIESSSYTAPADCQITVTDGTTTASARLTGCTTSQPPPPPPPPSAPAVTLTPSSLTFGPQDPGTTSAPQSITVTNSGTANLFINSAVTRGANPLDFTQVSDGCSGVTLVPSASCAVSIVFKPTSGGTRSATFIVTDNAPNSPQTAPITGTGNGAVAPLAIDTQFFTCANGVCDVAGGSSVFVNNFFTTTFTATGGTAPYTFTGQVPAGLVLRPSGILLGSPTTKGTQLFTVTVTDATGQTASGTFSLTPTDPPPPTPPGCQTGGTLTNTLSGPSFNGRTPRGTATADETQFSGCGGFSILSVQVSRVALPNGTRLWVTLDFKPVGTITLSNQGGTMARYNLGTFGVSRDAVRVFSALPDEPNPQEILIGGAFR